LRGAGSNASLEDVFLTLTRESEEVRP